jgi:hypothetical protein
MPLKISQISSKTALRAPDEGQTGPQSETVAPMEKGSQSAGCPRAAAESPPPSL